ncbi:bifunctional UDP-N-acetylglucosamine diphosphorylase/glucosamine-1-phosphate N-acetyltransferase GlmU [Bacillota bacterium LX-D]|nr:bifunctional UDP-N-acetylglucosamine diphosphorylase/glucosamine-1-phosphate N-acetyltransferase GlmU [Bacillota bacterium LX-D]
MVEDFNKIAAVILAAGKGTRMRSQLPKVLHKVAGKYLAQHVVDACHEIVGKTIIVVGHGGEQVQSALGEDLFYAWQKEQLGTGHAVLQAVEYLTSEIETVLVVCGDTPLLSTATLSKLLKKHEEEKAVATILTTYLTEPFGYGRIIRNEDQEVLKIVEQKDGTPEELEVKEINSGTYCFAATYLKEALSKIKPNNAQGEYYLTDVIGLLQKQGLKIAALATDDPAEIMGINDRVQLAQAEALVKSRINQKLMLQGVTIVDPEHTYIEGTVQIENDTIIYPNTYLQGQTKIGKGCEIGPNTVIVNSQIANEVIIKQSTVVESELGEGCQIGPYSYLRPGNKLGQNVKIGDFVELKKVSVGNNSKILHLSYIGDAQVGTKVNIGAGTITCNYDGEKKWPTIIGDGSFIGSNSNLVAPVQVESKAYVAAGSTITKDVPAGSLGVARSKQENILNWTSKKNKKSRE